MKDYFYPFLSVSSVSSGFIYSTCESMLPTLDILNIQSVIKRASLLREGHIFNFNFQFSIMPQVPELVDDSIISKTLSFLRIYIPIRSFVTPSFIV